MWEVLALGRLTGSETEFLTYILDVGSTGTLLSSTENRDCPPQSEIVITM